MKILDTPFNEGGGGGVEITEASTQGRGWVIIELFSKSENNTSKTT